MKETRRVRMTKQMIKDAYLELVKKHPNKRLSVTDICKVADVNRSTFYMHYEDVNQLLSEIESDILDRIPNPVDMPDLSSYNDRFLGLLEDCFNYIRENKKLFSILSTKLDNGSFNKRLIDTVLKNYRQQNLLSGTPFDKYIYIYCINGVMGLLREWLDEDFPINARQMAEIAYKMSIQATTELVDAEIPQQ